MDKKYIIEFTENEVDVLNEIFKVSIKKFNQKIIKNGIKLNKKTDTFFSAVNKIYNVKREL